MTIKFSYLLTLLAVCLPALAQDIVPCPEQGVAYSVSLQDVASNRLRVAMTFRPGASASEIQLPVWNATYQVRDFAQFVTNVQMKSGANTQGAAIQLRKRDKTTWTVSPSTGCATVEYDAFANVAGPFGLQVNSEHAFINWAQLLMYVVGRKDQPATIELRNVPKNWKLRDGGVLGSAQAGKVEGLRGIAPKYDALVDSPVELGAFDETSFVQDGAKYNIVVDAKGADYDLTAIATNLKKIVAAGVDWMGERPCEEYTFIYHFPRGQAGGGMEHACSTAIDVSADRLRQDFLTYAGVSAHEFFHAWNVKRIRPRSLEPIDYTQEQYSTMLWFSEGLTSTVSEHLLFRAGLVNESTFLARLADDIGELQSRPARKFQSVEESSLETWFDKYPFYRAPERSISYYNKGQIVGVLLDLQMRKLTGGRRSLRDLFQYMNARWAKQGKFFNDSESVRLALLVLTGDDFHEFFQRYISGTDELPYDLFETVGLRLTTRKVYVGNPGFTTSRNFGSPPVIVRVDPASEAAENGLVPGDIIATVDGRLATGDINALLRDTKPGQQVRLGIRSRQGNREIVLQLTARTTDEYVLEELANVTAAQRAERKMWMRGDSQQPSVEATQ